MKHILLLGGSGFIGNVILKQLAASGQYRVTAMQRHHPFAIEGGTNIQVLKGTLSNLDLNKLDSMPDVIIHAARNRPSRFGPLGRYIAAIKGARENRKLVAQLEQTEKKIKLIYISGSVLMYGRHPKELITEQAALNPISFAREYVKAELPIVQAIQKQKPDIIMARVPWVAGNGSWFKWFYMDYIERHQVVPVYGKGSGMMTFIDVEDLAASVIQLCHTTFSGAINLYYPQYLQQKQWASLAADYTGLPLRFLDDKEYERLSEAVKEVFEADLCLHSIHTDLQKQLQQNMNSPELMLKRYLAFALHHK